MEMEDEKIEGSILKLPEGLWRLEETIKKANPWSPDESLDDSIDHHDVIKEAGFNLQSKLAKGSFSTVWRGFWRLYKQPVALKVYNKSCHPINLSHIKIEIDILKKTVHPYIVSFFGAYETEFKVYLCLELLSGGNLLEYIKSKGPVGESQGKVWFAQLVAAVKYLHDLSIAHRDIKLENILLDSNLNLKLIDFGLALCPIERNVKVTDFCGSKAYLSPEIAQLKAYSPLSSDVWTLGVVLHAVLTGLFPFKTSEFKEKDVTALLKEWKYPNPISMEGSDVFKKIFVLEDTRIRAADLLDVDWFKSESFYGVFDGPRATKTRMDVEQEGKNEESESATKEKVNFWGEIHPHFLPAKFEC